jgi:hypothetical protein
MESIRIALLHLRISRLDSNLSVVGCCTRRIGVDPCSRPYPYPCPFVIGLESITRSTLAASMIDFDQSMDWFEDSSRKLAHEQHEQSTYLFVS